MNNLRNFLLILILVIAGASCNAKPGAKAANDITATSSAKLPRSTAAQEGVDPLAIKAMVDALMALPKTDLHHLMIVRHGKVIAEAHPAPFAVDEVHTLYSCSKTFTMLAIGMLIDDGKLRLTDKVVDLLPDKVPKRQSAALRAMTVKHLLTMTAGIKPSLTLQQEGDDWARLWLAQPVTKLGKFQYDSMCTFVLAAIVQRITGTKLLDFMNERFFHPLGITEADWEESPDGINVGGWGLRLTAESMAKAGVCIMNKGKWDGKQLISAKWLDEAQSKHTNYSKPGKRATDTNQGYCYQMWCCMQPGAYRADGAYGQFIVMLPEQDMVVVMTGVSHETGRELACIWNHLIPGVKNTALPANDKAQGMLADRLATLSLKMLVGNESNGMRSITLTLGENARHYKTMQLDHDGEQRYDITLTSTDGNVQKFPVAIYRWAKVSTAQAPPYNNAVAPVNVKKIDGLKGDYTVAGNYAWTSNSQLQIKLYWTNWIVANTFTVNLKSDGTATIVNDEGTPGIAPEVIKATYKYTK